MSLEPNELFNGKHLASPYYTDRYFSYTVLKGEVPDVVYDAFFGALAVDKTQAEKLWQELLASSTIWDLQVRFHFKRNEFSSAQASSLIALLTSYEAAITAKIQQAEIFDRHFDTAGLIASLLTFRVEATGQQAVLGAIFAADASFDLLYRVTYELLRPNRRGEPVSEALQRQAGTGLLARALQDAGDASLLATYPAATHFLFIVWVKVRDQASLQAYLHQHLPDEPALLQLVQAFAPRVSGGSYPEPYLSNFGPEQFYSMRKLFDPLPFGRLLSAAHREEMTEFPSAGHWQPADDNLLLRQFAYWYQHPPEDAA